MRKLKTKSFATARCMMIFLLIVMLASFGRIAEIEVFAEDNYWEIEGKSTYETFEAAQNAAVEGDTIKLLKDVNLTKSIEVTKNNLTIDLYGYKVDASNITSGNHRCVIYNNSTGLIVTSTAKDGNGSILKGTITGGSGVAVGDEVVKFYGGGVFNSSECSLTLSNCVISENGAYRGGGVYILSGTMNLTECTLTGNTASSMGGAVCSDNDKEATVTLKGCTISENSSGDVGGGVCNRDKGTMTLEECTIEKNTAVNCGGGVYNKGNITLTKCSVTENKTDTTPTSYSYGGGVYNYTGATVTLDNSTISKNESYSGGGVNGYGTINITECTVSENTATYSTGGIFICSGEATLKDTKVTKNSSPNAAGVFNQNGNLTITGGEISGNVETADGNWGAGVCNFGTGTLTVGGKAIIYGNKTTKAGEQVDSNVLVYKWSTDYPTTQISSESPLSEGAKIGIDFNFPSGENTVVKNGSKDVIPYFVYDNASYAARYDESTNALLFGINIGNYSVDPIVDQTYTGSPIEPEVVVKDGDTPLTKDTDYTVSYSADHTGNEITATTVTVTITGKGTYSGTKEVTFQILPLYSVKVSATPATVQHLEKITATATAVAPDGCSLVWSLEGSSAKGEIVKTSDNGNTITVVAQSSGELKITAKVVDAAGTAKVYDTATVTVEKKFDYIIKKLMKIFKKVFINVKILLGK